MNNSWLAISNAVLFAIQAGVNIAYAKYFVVLAREYETLITPANFAFMIWILIYTLEMVLVLVDLFYPNDSLYADASQPMQLRICFAFTCIANTAWVILYVRHHVYASTVMIFVLWLALLVLYIYSVNDRNRRHDFEWWPYICNELPIVLYFGWVTALAFTHLAIALQYARQSFLPMSTYVTHLTIVIILALVAILNAQEPVFGLVIIWYLISVSAKHVKMSSDIQCNDMGVRACAGQGAVILAALIVFGILQIILSHSDNSRDRNTVAGMGIPTHSTSGAGHTTYGTSSNA